MVCLIKILLNRLLQNFHFMVCKKYLTCLWTLKLCMLYSLRNFQLFVVLIFFYSFNQIERCPMVRQGNINILYSIYCEMLYKILMNIGAYILFY